MDDGQTQYVNNWINSDWFHTYKITYGVLWSLLSVLKAGIKKGNFIPVLNYAIKHYAMRLMGNGGIAPPFLTLALDGSNPAAFPAGM
jgi:hypothetical protein